MRKQPLLIRDVEGRIYQKGHALPEMPPGFQKSSNLPTEALEVVDLSLFIPNDRDNYWRVIAFPAETERDLIEADFALVIEVPATPSGTISYHLASLRECAQLLEYETITQKLEDDEEAARVAEDLASIKHVLQTGKLPAEQDEGTSEGEKAIEEPAAVAPDLPVEQPPAVALDSRYEVLEADARSSEPEELPPPAAPPMIES